MNNIYDDIPTTKSEALSQFKFWLNEKYGMSLKEFDLFLQNHFNTTLRESLENNWDCGLGYMRYVITVGIEDRL